MERLERAALITELLDRMRDNGGWTGTRHVHMCLYFLQEMRGVPLGFEFVIKGYGVFSWDLERDILELRVDELVTTVARQEPYSSALEPTKESRRIRQWYAPTLERHEDDLAFTAKHFGSWGTNQMQNASTAFYFLVNGAEDDGKIVGWIDETKPHVSWEEGCDALQEIKEIADRAGWERDPAYPVSPAALGTISRW